MKLPAILAVGILLGPDAQASEPAPTGHFVGSGRACHGTLSISTDTISWTTAFSRCKARPFHLVEDINVNGKRQLTFELSETTAACRFQVISLTHDDNSGDDTGWEATGYADLASYQADKRSAYTKNTPDMMSCALVRDSGQDRKPGAK
jgi:hypothetical protein